jgi:hypothetical protein
MNHKAVLVILALAAAAIVLLTTAPHGAGLSNDSIGYIAVARHLAAGMGALTEDGTALTVWPPLYPALLATISFASGADPLYIARFTNAVLFGCIIYLSGLLFLKHLKQSANCALLGTAFLLFAAPLMEQLLWVLSESLFFVFLLLYFHFINAYLGKRNLSSLVLLSLSVALACLTRYVGIILIASAAVSILFFQQNNARTKLQHLLLFICISALPLSAWIVHNYLISGTLAGHRTSSIFTLAQNITFTTQTLQDWYLPKRFYNYGAIIVVLGLTSIGLATHILKLKTNLEIKKFLETIHPLLFVIIFYIPFILIMSTHIAYDRIDNRLLSPIYIPLVILIVLFMYYAYQQITVLIEAPALKKWISKITVDILLVTGLSLWLLYQFAWGVIVIHRTATQGAGYSNEKWRNSATIQYILTNPELMPECKNYTSSYTNAPKALYIHTGIAAQNSPMKSMYNSAEVANTIYDLRRTWPEAQTACLIWFNNAKQPNLFALVELHTVANMHRLAKFNDGAVYSIEKK